MEAEVNLREPVPTQLPRSLTQNIGTGGPCSGGGGEQGRLEQSAAHLTACLSWERHIQALPRPRTTTQALHKMK